MEQKVSGVSPAAGLESGQSNLKRNFLVSYEVSDTGNAAPET
jgi:hypothetical protein